MSSVEDRKMDLDHSYFAVENKPISDFVTKAMKQANKTKRKRPPSVHPGIVEINQK